MNEAAELDLLLGAAASAGRIAMGYFRNNPKVSWKEGQSPVTDADLHADAHLRETLLSARPDHGWLSEETTDNPDRLTRRRTFVVDPIDGTRAFVEGRDLWCVSVALVEDGRTVAGVLDCPARGEVFAAVRGQGATLNGAPVHVSAPGRHPRLSGHKHLVAAFASSENCRPELIGHIPSLAYRIAMIAAGRLDGTFVKPRAHDWDLAAADLILAEAGGEILNSDGERPSYGTADTVHGALVAGTHTLSAAMLAVVRTSAFG